MHAVHYPGEGSGPFIGAVLGLMFDTANYEKSVPETTVEIIDEFFDSLKLDDLEETIAKFIPFGKLLDNINTNNRWIYKGSLTTPPCSKSIYWNVMATVYPIK